MGCWNELDSKNFLHRCSERTAPHNMNVMPNSRLCMMRFPDNQMLIRGWVEVWQVSVRSVRLCRVMGLSTTEGPPALYTPASYIS